MAITKRIRKDGSASYRVVISRRVNGKRVQDTIGTYRTKKEAVKAERNALDDLEAGRYVVRNIITVEEMMGEWLNHKDGKIESRTMSEYRHLTDKYIVPLIGGHKIQDVSTRDVQNMIDGLPLGDRSRKKSYQVLSQAFSFAVAMKITGHNPCDEVVVKNPTPKVYDLWTDEQYRKFLAVAERDTYGCLWHVLAVTGMRFGEAAGLRWSDVDWNTPALRVRQVVIPEHAGSGQPSIKPSPKTEGSIRTVTVGMDTVGVLRKFHNKHELISCYEHGHPLRHSGMLRKLRTICKAAGIPYLPPHGMRHLHATHLARAGVPLRVAMDRLGIATPGVLLTVYQQVDNGMQADAVTKMETMLNGHQNGNRISGNGIDSRHDGRDGG